MPTHYTVIYEDERNQRRHFCCYATGAYEARIAAMELNPHIHQNPIQSLTSSRTTTMTGSNQRPHPNSTLVERILFYSEHDMLAQARALAALGDYLEECAAWEIEIEDIF